jgi:Helix-turn-helix domain
VYLRHVAERSGRGVEGGGELQAPADRFSIGRYLASQRELRGISLDELASRTKIPRRNLERLESGAFDAQPDGFVRGFVRTVADALGLDSREAVMRMVGEPAGGDEDRSWWRARMAVLAVVLGGVLLLLGLGLRLATRWVVEPAGGPPDHVFRRDAVRSLAEHEARGGHPAPAGAETRARDSGTAPPADPMDD